MTAELVSAGIKVIAVSIDTGFYSAGLNDDPTSNAGDYSGTCPIGGTSGQANRIAAATGGAVFTGVGPDEVSNAILAGLTNLPVEVTPSATCSTGLTATFDAPSKTVTSGDDASFVETLTLAPDAPTGATRTAPSTSCSTASRPVPISWRPSPSTGRRTARSSPRTRRRCGRRTTSS